MPGISDTPDTPDTPNPPNPPTTDPRAISLISSPVVGPIMESAVHRASRICPALRDEFESQALVALWEAALAYRDESPMSWTQFLRVRLRNSLVDFRRTWTKTRSGGESKVPTFSIEKWVYDDSLGKALTVGEVLESGDLPVGWEIESQDSVERMVSRLGGKPRNAIRAMYTACAASRTELATRLGMNLGTMAHHHVYGIRAIREEMMEKGRAG